MNETWTTRWLRRAVTIPGYLGLTLTYWAVLPFLLPLAVLLDVLRRRPLPLTRTLLFFAVYLACESFGIVMAGILWLLRFGASHDDFMHWNFRLQCIWARWILGGAGRIFNFTLDVEEADSCAGPVLVFARHASVADTLLPAVTLSSRHGLRLRYVLKRELLWDPCIDVVGQRIPNVFVDRSSSDSTREIESVRRLAEGLESADGVLIYPEGTRFTSRKRERALQKLADSSDPRLLERARRLEHLLPPRLGGPLALLEHCQGVDVLFLAHVGFDGIATFHDLWQGTLIGRRVSIQLWRRSAAEIPTDRQARIDWLYDEWARVDAWIAQKRSTETSA